MWQCAGERPMDIASQRGGNNKLANSETAPVDVEMRGGRSAG
jgi:hypothetical protein